MSTLVIYEEQQPYINYNGRLNVHTQHLYVPIILNKKYIYVVGDPYSPKFKCPVVTKTTTVMEGIHIILFINSTQWRTPRRMRYMN